MTPVSLKGGDYAYNLTTGQVRLVIAACPFTRTVTFSGSTAWVPMANWVTNVR